MHRTSPHLLVTVPYTSCQGVSWILANLRKQLKTHMAFPACFLRAGIHSSLSLWNFYVINVICAHMYISACARMCITFVPVYMETWRQLQVSSTIQLLSTFSGLWGCVVGQGLSLSLELTHSAGLTRYQDSWIFSSLPPQDPRRVPSWCLAFYISSGDSNSGPYVCTANTYQLSPLRTKFSLNAAQSTVMGDLKG